MRSTQTRPRNSALLSNEVGGRNLTFLFRLQYDVDYAYENTTFCNKNKLEDEMRAQRAATVLGGARSRPGTVLGSYKDRCDDLPSVRSDEHLVCRNPECHKGLAGG